MEIKDVIRDYFENREMTPSGFNQFLVNLRVGNKTAERRYLLEMAAKHNFPLRNATEEERQIYDFYKGLH